MYMYTYIHILYVNKIIKLAYAIIDGCVVVASCYVCVSVAGVGVVHLY